MQIVPMKDNKMFALAGLSFAELKTIKDACGLFGQQGSSTAKAINQTMEKLMGEISI